MENFKWRSMKPITDIGYYQQEQDAPLGSISEVVDKQLYECFKDSKNSLEKDFPALIQFIVKMRFHADFSNSSRQQLLDLELEKRLLKTSVNLFGFKMLENPKCTVKHEQIQSACLPPFNELICNITTSIILIINLLFNYMLLNQCCLDPKFISF
jgi:hypothetical protein